MFWQRLFEKLLHKTDVSVPEFLGPMAEDAKLRSRFQRMNKGSADKTFMRREKFKLAMYKGEKFFFERCFPKSGVRPDRVYCLVHFLLEKVQRDLLFGFEVIKDRTLSDARFARNRFGGRGVEAFCLKEA